MIIRRCRSYEVCCLCGCLVYHILSYSFGATFYHCMFCIVLFNFVSYVFFIVMFMYSYWYVFCRSQWPRGLRRRSSASRLLRSWVRIPPRAWMFVCCECCVVSGRGLCDELIIRSEESYRLWCVVVCDQKTS